ncbi:hypothetical protein Drose_09255 [Dactylosporangium roseum]|uniref:DUF2795 domain-containing protein n=1 Tax=Dactylosporangium roseum TaxID=47989 RepID=A0ABY5ZDU5_9ACTN|nr:hypothetical protein Drose_09255 [Dactylosporangium roseum]
MAPARPGFARSRAGTGAAVTSEPDLRSVLETAFTGQERLSREEIRRKAIAADLPADALTRVDALPEGEYAEDEVIEALRLGSA